MITFWHCIDARSFRPLWALEEIGLAYRLEMLPFPPRLLARGYLEINPLGAIPLLIDGDAQMTESAAIHLPISRRALCRTADRRSAGRAGLWRLSQRAPFRRGDADVSASRHPARRPVRAQRSPPAVDDYGRWTLGRLAGFESLMGGAEHVAAGRFTVADISVGYALMLLKYTKLFDRRRRKRPRRRRACSRRCPPRTARHDLRPGQTLTIEELREFAGVELARFKLPRHLQIVAALRRNATGKILKYQLHQTFAKPRTGR
jgi:glutathione S-transferase